MKGHPYVHSIFTLLLIKQFLEKKSHQQQTPKSGRSFIFMNLVDFYEPGKEMEILDVVKQLLLYSHIDLHQFSKACYN